MASNELIANGFTNSAVIVLYEQESDSLILTKRSDQLRTHPGEICFPGGVWEESDENYYATALRELNEELGINPHRVTLIKELKIQKTLLGSIIHPWFAGISSIHPYHLNVQEVVSVISIPMSLVQNPKNYRTFMIERNGLRYKTCEFTANEDWVWGATARIMQQLVK
ncbi:MutT/nudix family transporter protein [Legionella sainthelensi]|uniref:MutT/nudix family transporter protein n=1 Tax=Legionella sainthelensi TaxID=28087 RepID=A0A0W0YC26_9GAMM|nr:CoA pyrophosphatase [Legionella sainthelensi]KTD54445.1 MutT/nudix family transporter protein [Legionella sainthelensi]VEH33311.1 MutT/nudix family transporter protein [Legionella sainthelensi]